MHDLAFVHCTHKHTHAHSRCKQRNTCIHATQKTTNMHRHTHMRRCHARAQLNTRMRASACIGQPANKRALANKPTHRRARAKLKPHGAFTLHAQAHARKQQVCKPMNTCSHATARAAHKHRHTHMHSRRAHIGGMHARNSTHACVQVHA
jgi:hypothetical protein